jgi:CRISPR system Cascade subunit CasD
MFSRQWVRPSMTTLLLRLEGPLQSWGTTSRFGERETGSEPSKSGVLGLLAAALGRSREQDISDLCALRMGVRCDEPGTVIRDYHTALDVVSADRKNRDTVVTHRFYLSGAAFWVGFEGSLALLSACHAALAQPHWPLFLGRKACPPSVPVYVPEGLVELPLLDALAACPHIGMSPSTRQHRFLIEDPEGRLLRPDQPLAPFAERRFGNRSIREEFLACS